MNSKQLPTVEIIVSGGGGVYFLCKSEESK